MIKINCGSGKFSIEKNYDAIFFDIMINKYSKFVNKVIFIHDAVEKYTFTKDFSVVYLDVNNFCFAYKNK